MNKKDRISLKIDIYQLDWIKILKQAIDRRPRSWSENPIWEWRNAGDEVCHALVQALEEKGILEPFKPK